MNISSTSTTYIAPSTALQGAQASAVNSASDPDGDGDGGRRAHRGHRGGGMQQALDQALQSLGLAPTQTGSSSASQAANGTGTDSDGDNDGTGASASKSIRADERNFMHALFQAVKSETSASSGSTPTSPTDPKANFANGLTALISQVSSGSAPPDLQAAFDKLTTDLQAASGASGSASGSTSGGASGSSPSATLQQLLTQLQQNLGYGAAGSATAVGNLVSTHA